MRQAVFDDFPWPQAGPESKADCSIDNLRYLGKITYAQLIGQSSLPHGLGLDSSSYQDILQAIAIEKLCELDQRWYQADWQLQRNRAELFGQMLQFKLAERNELVTLLLESSDPLKPYTPEVAIVVASACLAPAHLWRALGLDNRQQLSDLLQHNFPRLFALNIHNMRWKRFLYLQLCQKGGDYICRAPSCHECTSYSECFSAED